MGIRMRYFHIDNESNIVVNICIWDGVSKYNPPNVNLLLAEDLPKIKMGDRKNGNIWERYDNELEVWNAINVS